MCETSSLGARLAFSRDLDGGSPTYFNGRPYASCFNGRLLASPLMMIHLASLLHYKQSRSSLVVDWSCVWIKLSITNELHLCNQLISLAFYSSRSLYFCMWFGSWNDVQKLLDGARSTYSSTAKFFKQFFDQVYFDKIFEGRARNSLGALQSSP